MKKQNSIDLLVENLASEFSKIKNFELTQDDPLGNKVFTFVVKHASELTSFKNLFVHYYLPASLKSSQDYTRELKFSKYKHLIKIDTDELKENYYETIRLGYVGAFHKYETYIKNISSLMDDFFLHLFDEGNYQNIESYLKENFDIELRKTINKFYASEKINWIANCVKHYDGYPIKEPILHSFIYKDKNKKIQIESKEFREDLDNLSKQNQLILTALFLSGFHQYIGQEFLKIKDQLTEGKNEEDVIDIRQKLGKAINNAFNL
jgi:Holliday junction resolvase RusA-like endonuclease